MRSIFLYLLNRLLKYDVITFNRFAQDYNRLEQNSITVMTETFTYNTTVFDFSLCVQSEEILSLQFYQQHNNFKNQSWWNPLFYWVDIRMSNSDTGEFIIGYSDKNTGEITQDFGSIYDAKKIINLFLRPIFINTVIENLELSSLIQTTRHQIKKIENVLCQ